MNDDVLTALVLILAHQLQSQDGGKRSKLEYLREAVSEIRESQASVLALFGRGMAEGSGGAAQTARVAAMSPQQSGQLVLEQANPAAPGDLEPASTKT